MKLILLLAAALSGSVWSEEVADNFEPLAVIIDPNTGIQRHIYDYGNGKLDYGQVRVERTTYAPPRPSFRQEPEYSNIPSYEIDNRHQPSIGRHAFDSTNYNSYSNNFVQPGGQQTYYQSSRGTNNQRPGEKEPISFVGQDGITYNARLEYEHTPKPKTAARDYVVRFRRGST